MNQPIIARKKEQKVLDATVTSNESEFMAVYGRRRVGKTYLIVTMLEQLKLRSIQVTGLKDGDMKQQLAIFMRAFKKTFTPGFKLAAPEDWMEAFEMLTSALDQLPKNKKFVIFLDELPWLATPRSGLIQALDHFWNTDWQYRKNLKLITCGSAASWMLENLINAKGGLHDRLSRIMLVKPLNLQQTAEFVLSRGLNFSKKQILDIYLIMGGIPFYLKGLQKGYSVTQNIDNLCFKSDGLLFGEFNKLYASLFKNAQAYIEVIQALAKYPKGLSQEKLLSQLKLSVSGGTFTKRLDELEQAGFILSFVPYGRDKKGVYYRIVDEYSLFYLRWISPAANRIKLTDSASHYWQSKSQSPGWKSWVGYAFESFCYKHIEQIARALDIHCGYEIGTWQYSPKSANEKGTQIDLILDRDDGVINIIEIKYADTPYRITKQYAGNLGDKIDIFTEQLKITKTVYLTMITLNGLLPNSYSDVLVSNEIEMAQLFD